MKIIVNNITDLSDELRGRIAGKFTSKNYKPVLDVLEMRFVRNWRYDLEIFARDNLAGTKCMFITYPEYLLITTILQMMDKKLRVRRVADRDKMRLWLYKADEDMFIRLDDKILM